MDNSKFSVEGSDSATPERDIQTDWMNLSEVALYLKCKERHIRDLVYRREIPHSKVGRLLRFHRREVDRWLLKTR